LRIKHHIPAQGIKTNEESQQWFNDFYDRDELYFQQEWPKQREILTRLRERDYGEFLKEKTRLNKLSPINALYHDVNVVTTKYKLGPRWRDSIRRYLLFNDIEKMQFPLGVQINIGFEDSPEGGVLQIVIEENTTLRDIKAAWPRVKYYQDRLPYKKYKKSQPIRKFERNKMAFELLKKYPGKPSKAAEELCREDNIEKLREKPGTVYMTDDILAFSRLYEKEIEVS